MGLPTSPQDAPPAYGHVPSSSRSGYNTVPQEDDLELGSSEHAGHVNNIDDVTPAATESLAQTIAGVFRPKPHVHCEQCDAQLEIKMRRDQEKHCCTMVSTVFIVAFICMMLTGIIATATIARSRRNHG